MKSLHGIWESETRKQNGHWQGANAQIPIFEKITIPQGEVLVSILDTQTNTYYFGAPGYKSEDTIQKTDEETYTDRYNRIWTLEHYGTHKYKPDTGYFTTINDMYPGYGPNWFKYYTGAGVYVEEDIGTGAASGIVRDWLCPTYELHKLIINGNYSISRADLDTLFNVSSILMDGPRYTKNFRSMFSTSYGPRLNQVPPLTGAISPNDFEASYSTPPLPSPWSYTTNSDIVDAFACIWYHRAGNPANIDIGVSNTFFKADDYCGYYKENSGGQTIIWAAILRKILKQRYPMTS